MRTFLWLALPLLLACGRGDPGAAPKRRADGGRGARAAGPTVPAAGPAAIEIVRWREPGERVAIGPAGVALGPRGGPLARTLYASRERPEELRAFVAAYRPFATAVPHGGLRFHGRGREEASATDRRRIAEWARLVAAEAAGGRGGAAYGLAFAWHRGGDSAGGECDDVAVYLTGEVRASSCSRPGERAGHLATAELARIYDWFDGLRPFQAGEDGGNGERPARLVFAGRGNRIATAGEQDAIAGLAARLHDEMLPALSVAGAPGEGAPAGAPVPRLLRPLRRPPPAALVVAAPLVPPKPPKPPNPPQASRPPAQPAAALPAEPPVG